MKIYTKTGDKGETGLVGGKRVSKGERRIQAYGEVDELCAVVGLASSFLEHTDGDLQDILTKIQEELFVVGADLATPPDYKGKRFVPKIGDAEIEHLEKLIDHYSETLPELKHFILPSGSRCGTLLHLARTVCRRAEREVVRLRKEIPAGPEVVKYLNRLSDFLFILAREVNQRQNISEIPWIPEKKGSQP